MTKKKNFSTLKVSPDNLPRTSIEFQLKNMGFDVEELLNILTNVNPQLDKDRNKEINRISEEKKTGGIKSSPVVQSFTVPGTIKYLAKARNFSPHEEYKNPVQYIQQSKDLLLALRNSFWEEARMLSEKLVQENDKNEREIIGEEKKIVDNTIFMLTQYTRTQNELIRNLTQKK